MRPLISGRSGAWYVVMVTKLVCSYCGANLLESSDSNWLRHLFSSWLIKIRLWLWRYHLSNLHMKKKLEYLSNKKRYLKIMNRILLLENFVIFGNGLDRKNANFVKLLLFNVCCYTNRQYLLLWAISFYMWTDLVSQATLVSIQISRP